MLPNSAAIVLPGISLDGIGGEGVFGELTVGYDYMVSPRFLFGALADVHYSNIETKLEVPGLDASASDTYGFDLGLRAGYLFTPSTLGYVLGGYAWQKGEIEVSGDWAADIECGSRRLFRRRRRRNRRRQQLDPEDRIPLHPVRH